MTFDTVLIAVLAVVFFAVLVRASFGFGEALLAMPVLTILLGIQFAAAYMAILSVFITAAILAAHWRHVKLGPAVRLVLASWAGIPLGLLLLAFAESHEPVIKMLLGVIVVSFALFKLFSPERLFLETDRTCLGCGLVAGVLAGAYNTPGPPIVVFGTLRRWTPDQFRATLQGFALPCSVVVVAGHGISGRVTAGVLWLIAVSLPLAMLAVLLGRWFARPMRDRKFVQLIYVLLLGLGISLIANAVEGYGVMRFTKSRPEWHPGSPPQPFNQQRSSSDAYANHSASIPPEDRTSRGRIPGYRNHPRPGSWFAEGQDPLATFSRSYETPHC